MSDLVGTTNVLLVVAIAITGPGIVSIVRGDRSAAEEAGRGHGRARLPAWTLGRRDRIRGGAGAAAGRPDTGSLRGRGAMSAAAEARRRRPGSRDATEGRRAGRGGRRHHRGRMSATRAELLVIGRIATLAGRPGPGWVEAVAVAGGRVVAAGSRADVEGLAGPRRGASGSPPTRWPSPG